MTMLIKLESRAARKARARDILDKHDWPTTLGNIDRSAKTVKGLKYGVSTFITYLAPHTLSGRNVCPKASAGCVKVCLNTAGRGGMTCTQVARIRKTEAYFRDRSRYMLQLEKELRAFQRNTRRRDLIPAVRLNGTSDIRWENIGFHGADGTWYASIFARFPELQFYDYTKWTPSERPRVDELPNYHITFSYAEDNHERALEALAHGWNVAVVFRKDLPDTWQGYKVLDGDTSDIRFTDEPGCVVGLKAKGKARHDDSGFVVDCEGQGLYRVGNQTRYA